jgi:uncharacterized protein (TIGR02996 family)
MTDEAAFLKTMLDRPNDLTLRQVFADWLEERGDPRGELVRLLHTLTQSTDLPDRDQLEARMQTLLRKRVQPVGPFQTNALGMQFAWIPAGQFLMGSPLEEHNRMEDEVVHRVILTTGFFMAMHLVTQAEWQAVMGHNYSHWKGKRLPVEDVSWDECVEFCDILRKQDGKQYRLPTEAEWEFACRAGSTTAFYYGNDETKLGQYAWYEGNSKKKTHPVGKKKPNTWGLHDMHGNLAEWCSDWYGPYPNKQLTNPKGPSKGPHRVKRGSSWFTSSWHSRSAMRRQYDDSLRNEDVGFRICYEY